MDAQAVIWTEGKTDWQHLMRAFRGGTQIAFHEAETDFGDDQLLNQCTALARIKQPLFTILILG
jgi:hypothetical protein